MPEIGTEGLDVSAEEERYLRGAFRRFAVPYLIVTLAMAGVAVAVVSLGSGDPGGRPSDELESMVAEAASLREAIAAVRQELRDHATDASARLAKLESDARAAAGGSADAELVSRLDRANQRISELEDRLSELQMAGATAPSPALAPTPAPEPAPDEAPSWAPASPSLP
jgi:hypothetical protein